MKVIDYHEVPVLPLDDPQMQGVSMRVVAGPDDGCANFVMRVFELEPNGHTTLHAHPHEHEVFFFAGSGEVLKSDEWVAVGPGSVAAIPGGTRHQIRAGSQGLKLICVVPADRSSKLPDSFNPCCG